MQQESQQAEHCLPTAPSVKSSFRRGVMATVAAKPFGCTPCESLMSVVFCSVQGATFLTRRLPLH